MIHNCNGVWPVVLPNDDGIRPAGKPDECFYCYRKVGLPHREQCVTVTSKHRYTVYMNLDGRATEENKGKKVGTFTRMDPWHWTGGDAEFHKNQSSWCASNALDGIEWDDEKDAEALEKWMADAGHGCACGPLYFEFDDVAEEGPFIELREEPKQELPQWDKKVEDSSVTPADS